MRTSRGRLRDRGVIGLFTAASLIAFGSPATAQPPLQGEVTGAGAGGGFEYGTDMEPVPCPGLPLVGHYAGSRFELDHQGTYDGATTSTLTTDPTQTKIASYIGPTHITIETGPYVISPEGTYSDCDTPGEDELNNATVTSSAGDGSVSCNLDGYWQRRAFDIVEFRLHGPCTVTGNVADLTETVQDQETTHIITGVMHPCYYPVPDEDPVTGEPVPYPPPLDQGVPPGGCQVDPDASAILVTDYVVVPSEVAALDQPLPPQ